MYQAGLKSPEKYLLPNVVGHSTSRSVAEDSHLYHWTFGKYHYVNLCTPSTISELSGALLSVIADLSDFSGTLLSVTTEMDISRLVQYRSNVSYHRLVRNETRIARNETRIARRKRELSREKFLVSRECTGRTAFCINGCSQEDCRVWRKSLSGYVSYR